MPLSAWKRIVIRAWNQSWLDSAGLVAAGVAFYGFIALIPMLGILVLAFGSVADTETVVATIQALAAILPADIAGLVGGQLIAAVETSEGRKGFAIIAALALALYGGTNASSAIIMALNITYQEKEKRSLLRFYLLAMAMTVGALILALLAIAATTAVIALDRLVPNASGAAVIAGRIASYAVLMLGAATIAATLYRFGPSREQARWSWITPGSIFTAIGWLLLTLVFAFYITEVTDYSASYGPLGAMVALLTWMYLSAYVFVFGAELNSEVEHQTAQDSTTGAPEPMGRRGAWAADHVADDDEDGTSAKVVEDQPSMAEASPTSAKPREDE